MKTKNFKIILCSIILFFVIYYIVTYKYLSQNQLYNTIYGKLAIHQSLSSPTRLYKIYYNLDNTFKLETIENGKYTGTTTGNYSIISKYNIGYIDITYLDIKESPHQQSAFSTKNKNSIHKTMKNVLGPFILHQQENRSGYILEYNTNYAKSKKYMTVFSQ